MSSDSDAIMWVKPMTQKERYIMLSEAYHKQQSACIDLAQQLLDVVKYTEPPVYVPVVRTSLKKRYPDIYITSDVSKFIRRGVFKNKMKHLCIKNPGLYDKCVKIAKDEGYDWIMNLLKEEVTPATVCSFSVSSSN